MVKLRCPNCVQLVNLPATDCPFCRADLRTGLAPPEEPENLWFRKGLKLSMIILAVLTPFLVWVIGPILIQQKAKAFCYSVLSLDICAPEANLTRDLIAMTQAMLKDMVRAGFMSWSEERNTRVVTGGKQGAFSEARAKRDYFLSTLARLDEAGLGQAPGERVEGNDLFDPLLGEWDVIWIEAPDTPEERIAQGEWIFVTIAGGLAVEDILTVPYLHQAPDTDGPVPLRLITLRQFNHERLAWDGVSLLSGGLRPVLTMARPGGGLDEFSVDSKGETTTRRITDLTPESFRLFVSVAPSANAPARPIGELWAKKRVIVTP